MIVVRSKNVMHRFAGRGSGRRRRLVVSSLATIVAMVAAMFALSIPASAAGTNGDPITWAQTQCIANVGGGSLATNIDITVQGVVPDTANQGDAYDATIPGGTTTLPDTSNGFNISGYKNLDQTYLLRSSSGNAAITGVTANGGATNNGNPITYNTSYTNTGAAMALSTGSWSSANGGTITYTTTAAHGLHAGQLVDITGAHNPLYNMSGAVVAAVPTSTTFTVTGRSYTITSATWSAVGGGTITFGTAFDHHLQVGDTVSTINSSPGKYNVDGVVSAVDDSTHFEIAGASATDPGPITTKGVVDTLGKPGSIGSPKGNVNTLTTVTLDTPTAQPGTLTVPDVTVNMTAPSADATVTTYGGVVTTTATLVPLGDAATTCNLPHNDPQTDGISATVVGAGGPTTTSYPTCRPPDVCATTTTSTPPAPTVTSVSPTSGTTAGGTSVTITGTNLTGASDVEFGATAAASYTVDNDTQITATSPAESAGTVDITVTTSGGTSATNAGDQYTFTAPAAPTVTSVSPTSGSTAGGTSVTITGTNLTGASDVEFGATPATTYTVDNDTQITATSPAGSGTVDITVTTGGGTSATNAGDQYTYVAAPTVTSVSPTSGPRRVARA